MNEILKQKLEHKKIIEDLVAKSILILEEKINSTNAFFDQYKKRNYENDLGNQVDNLVHNLKKKEYLFRIDKYKNSITEYEYFLKRCNEYIKYCIEFLSKNLINEVGIRYSLVVGIIQEEMIFRLQNEINSFIFKIDIDDDCLLLCETAKKQGMPVPEIANILSIDKEEKLKMINSIGEKHKTLENYKNKFKEEKFEITEEMIDHDLFFNYDIEKVVNELYSNKKEKKDELQIK